MSGERWCGWAGRRRGESEGMRCTFNPSSMSTDEMTAADKGEQAESMESDGFEEDPHITDYNKLSENRERSK